MAEEFGTTVDGEVVHRHRIAGGGLTACILTRGAALQDMRIDGHAPPLVLGFDRLKPYRDHPLYMGAVVGRFANRIAGGRFAIDGVDYQAESGSLHGHALHGGPAGFDTRLWHVAGQGEDFLRLTYVSADGEMGFPGRLTAICTYSLPGDGRLTVELEATADAPTMCNLSHHAYFNLDDGGASPALDHRLRIVADHYLPVDDTLIPTGEVAPVDGARFDFSNMRTVRSASGEAAHSPYDHNFCTADAAAALRPVARLCGARSGLHMALSATAPGLQFFDGASIPGDLAGLDGIAYGPHSGLCLEPQGWPDSPNHPHFPQAVLRPGEMYRNVIEYRFGIGP